MTRLRWRCKATTALWLAALACLSWSTASQAQDGLPVADGPISGSSEVTIGLGLARGPVYLGSDEHRTRALPVIAARWSNGWFAGVNGVGYRFGATQPFSWGLRMTLDPGRNEGDAEALRGMGDIEQRPEVGLFASYRLVPGVTVGSSVRYGSGNDRDGLLADIGLRGSHPVAPTVRLTFGLTATVGDSKSMRSAFGVNATQSLSSGYAPYNPSGGLRDVSTQFGGIVMLQRNLMMLVGVSATSLSGDAKDSPLTRDPTGVRAFATLAYRL
jgi:MipA family protein